MKSIFEGTKPMQGKELEILRKTASRLISKTPTKLKGENKMKKIELKISNCSECPYCRYDSYYSMSRDSGYDCRKTGNRIIDDWEYNNTNNPNRIVKDYDGNYPIPMPDWCPLEDVNGGISVDEFYKE